MENVFFFILMIVCIIFVIFYPMFCVKISKYKENKKDDAINEIIETIVPGTILTKVIDDKNPFVEPNIKKIKVIDVSKNKYGEVWIKYSYEYLLTGEFNDSIPFYSEAKDILKLYPNIILPNEQ